MNVTVPIPANQLGKVRIHINILPIEGASEAGKQAVPKQRIRNASVHLSGLSRHIKRSDVCDALTRILGSYGEIADIRVPIDLATGFLKGYAFVAFKDAEAAARVLNRSRQLGPILNQYLPASNITLATSKGF